MPDKVVIGYVHPGKVDNAWFRCILAALNADRGKHLGKVLGVFPSNIAESRCDVVRLFLEEGDEDWLWFIDTDIVFPADTHLQLLEAADPVHRPIVTAAYMSDWTGSGDITPVWTLPRDEEMKPVAEMPDRVVQLASCGAGCLLVHRNVFEKIAAHEQFGKDPWPWFSHEIVQTRQGLKRLGEDYTFCVRALECGFPIVGIPLVVGHRKVVVLDESWLKREVADAVC